VWWRSFTAGWRRRTLAERRVARLPTASERGGCVGNASGCVCVVASGWCAGRLPDILVYRITDAAGQRLISQSDSMAAAGPLPKYKMLI
jgi:hypothetical protein